MKRIAVVGGGPAGLVAAIAARRAGFDCDVFEQAPSFARIGGAIGIQSNGRAVLDALGLHRAFDQFIEITNRAAVEAPPGKRISHADFNEIDHPYRGFGVALRYDLQEMLLQAALAAGANVHFNKRCVGACSAADHAEVQFADDTTHSADVVLACDGVRSAVRQSMLFRAEHSHTGEACLRIVVPIDHPDRTRVGEFWAPDGRRAGAFALPGNRTYMFCSVPRGRWQDIIDAELAAWVASWDDFGAPISTLMRAVNDWTLAVYDELSDLRVERWYDGRVFLVGDAAHAMTPNLGQGANSAMVDALVLVNMLAQSDDVAGVGRAYEEIRRPFVTRIQATALMGGRMAGWRSAPARALRDAAFSLASRIPPVRRSSLRLVAGINPKEQAWLR